ncbi:MAG TPA: sigma-70 family RNA polymerase sigma factor [Nocardioides sp.]|nr:sigma-70 family RNA polymerase sigma factor [Nocardioides sp.]
MTSDDEIVAAAKRGDAEAWRELYRAHAGRLLVWLETRATLGSGDTPDDLAAATWLVAAERIADFHGSSSEFAGWLFGIGRNHASNSRRRTARRHSLDAAMAPDLPVHPGHESSLIGDAWVREALASLPARERDVLTCLEVLDLDVATTAEALGVSAVSVRVARHRALKRLRRLTEQP